jgi:hypothetical protein
MLPQTPSQNGTVCGHLRGRALPEQALPPAAKTAKWPLYLENPALMQGGNTVTDQQQTSRVEARDRVVRQHENMAADAFPTNELLNSTRASLWVIREVT